MIKSTENKENSDDKKYVEYPADTEHVYGQIDGVEITDEVIERLVKNAENGFPDTRVTPLGRPSRTGERSSAITVRLSESELAAVMRRAEREQVSRSTAIRAALMQWASAA